MGTLGGPAGGETCTLEYETLTNIIRDASLPGTVIEVELYNGERIIEWYDNSGNLLLYSLERFAVETALRTMYNGNTSLSRRRNNRFYVKQGPHKNIVVKVVSILKHNGNIIFVLELKGGTWPETTAGPPTNRIALNLE